MTETTPYTVTKGRHFSKVEQQMIWRKPDSHQTSAEEMRIASEIKLNWDDPEMKVMNVLLEGDAGSGKTQLARALSADLQLPYTKVTCFADMDKTDVFGALLPIVTADDEADNELLEAIYQADCLSGVLELIARHYSISQEKARERFAELIQRVTNEDDNRPVRYKFYPSEIVRAIEKGYLLEIQEPTVIRDASVLVALNSALENNGILNIPTGIIRRHPDCVVVITTNRNYQGNRPLNESLRDRVQHAEKMDLPSIEVMMERAQSKTGYDDTRYLEIMAKIIRLLDETAKANAIKGVAGMRSYFFWVNSLKQGQNPLESIFPKVLYKLTTEENELSILSNALDDSGLLIELQQIKSKAIIYENKGRVLSADEADKRNITQEAEQATLIGETTENPPDEAEVEPEKTMESIKEEPTAADTSKVEETPNTQRRELNRETRAVLKETIHAKEGTIVHRPKLTTESIDQGKELTKIVLPEVESLSRVINDLLEKEESTDYSSGKYYGSRFNPARVAYGDLRNFDKKNPPAEQPSLALAVRVDESGSMVREDRIEKAKQAALALGLFAEKTNIPFTLYGDSADVSQREKTSLYSYKEFNDPYDFLAAKIATMKPRQNNRDGVPLRLLAEKLSNETADTKLLLNISDGQPKALPDYTAKKAQTDIQQVLADYERKGIIFIACAIGEDKESIKSIYGEDRFVDISDLSTMPQQLLQLIGRFV